MARDRDKPQPVPGDDDQVQPVEGEEHAHGPLGEEAPDKEPTAAQQKAIEKDPRKSKLVRDDLPVLGPQEPVNTPHPPEPNLTQDAQAQYPNADAFHEANQERIEHVAEGEAQGELQPYDDRQRELREEQGLSETGVRTN